MRLLSHGLPSAGILLSPAAWLANTQVNFALAAWSCAHRVQAVPAAALPLAALSLAGAALSWRALRRPAGAGRPESGSGAVSLDAPQGGRPHRLVAAIGVLTGLLFTLAIAVQGAAGLVFDGCER